MEEKKKSGFATASLILGIISFLLSFSFFADLSLICGVIAIVLGTISVVKKNSKGMAIAGIVLACVGCVVLFSDTNSNNTGTITKNDNTSVVTKNENLTNEENSLQSKKLEEQVLNIGDTWTVDGQWKMTIDSVKTITDRNPYADVQPQQIIIITYSYENLGYERDYSDGLYFDLDQNGDASSIDALGEMAINYPGSISKYPQDVPVGAKCTGAQTCIGLMNESENITMIIKKYDGNGNSQSVKCNLKID